jgi:hypothetical protein
MDCDMAEQLLLFADELRTRAKGNLGQSSEHRRLGSPRHDARNRSGLRETGAAGRQTRS